MKTALLSLLICLSLSASAQNLVPNPSFENFTNCPTAWGRIQCPLTTVFPPTLISWYSAIPNSPDFFHDCSVVNTVKVPNNFFGNLPTHSGLGFAGIVAYNESFLNNTPAKSYREYLGCKLTQPLVAGNTYKLTMWVRSFARQQIANGLNFRALDALEARFTNNTVTSNTSPITAVGIPVQLPLKGFITDTVWVQISATYTATGGEEYLTIGTFNNNVTPPTQHIYPNPPHPGTDFTSYYMIDDVALYNATNCDTTIQVHDSFLCSNNNIFLTPKATGSTYEWNTGASTSTLTATNAGTYWRVAKDGCDAKIDTFRVKSFQDSIAKVHNKQLCADQTEISLQSSFNNADKYSWNTGANTSSIMVDEGGVHVCKAIKDCVIYYDSFNVIGNKTYVNKYTKEACFPSELHAIVTNGDSTIWNTGSRTNDITIHEKGVYSCVVYKNCDRYIDSFFISKKEKISHIDLGRNKTICDDAEILIGEEFNGAVSYLWNTGSTECCIAPNQSGVYTVKVNNGCRELTASIKVEKVSCKNCIILPNAFSPNSDGLNDYMRVIAKCPFSFFSFNIYNRFGEVVYQSSDISDKWDGHYKGQPVDMGAYYFLIRYTTLGDAKTHTMKGDITVVY